MRTNNNANNDFILSSHPYLVTVSELRSWVNRDDEEAKKLVIDFIYHRLHDRYIEPLLHIPAKYKSGFLIMALASLLLETLESFHSGKENTKGRGEGKKAFREFFKGKTVLFPGFVEDEDNFYHNIRCGILHQAETTGGYRILRRGKMFDKEGKTINANKFIEAVGQCLDKYLSSLPCDQTLWDNAVIKLKHICDHCET